jgi:hypothetical protein
VSVLNAAARAAYQNACRTFHVAKAARLVEQPS